MHPSAPQPPGRIHGKGLDALFLIAYISSGPSTFYLGVKRKRIRASDKAGQRKSCPRLPDAFDVFKYYPPLTLTLRKLSPWYRGLRG